MSNWGDQVRVEAVRFSEFSYLCRTASYVLRSAPYTLLSTNRTADSCRQVEHGSRENRHRKLVRETTSLSSCRHGGSRLPLKHLWIPVLVQEACVSRLTLDKEARKCVAALTDNGKHKGNLSLRAAVSLGKHLNLSHCGQHFLDYGCCLFF